MTGYQYLRELVGTGALTVITPVDRASAEPIAIAAITTIFLDGDVITRTRDGRWPEGHQLAVASRLSAFDSLKRVIRLMTRLSRAVMFIAQLPWALDWLELLNSHHPGLYPLLGLVGALAGWALPIVVRALVRREATTIGERLSGRAAPR